VTPYRAAQNSRGRVAATVGPLVGGFLNNRELAVLIWLGLAAVGVLWQNECRRAIGALIKHLVTTRVPLFSVIAMPTWMAIELWFGIRVSLWNISLLFDTAAWAIGTAAVLWLNISRAAEDPAFFRKTLKGTIGVAVFLEFFLNIFVLGFWAEFFLQPMLAFVALVAFVAGQKPQHRQVKRVFDWLLAILGFWGLGFAMVELAQHWRDLDAVGLSRQFVLPIWMTVGMLPFFWVMSLVLVLDRALRSINWATLDKRTRWRTRSVLLREFGRPDSRRRARNDWKPPPRTHRSCARQGTGAPTCPTLLWIK
jgi:hypothetical protein